jgi:hypothetical protein
VSCAVGSGELYDLMRL